MNCPNCGTPLPPDAAFCTECGTPVPAQVPAMADADTAPKRVCENCGAPLDDDAVFCSECGTPVPAQAPDEAPFATPAEAPAAPAMAAADTAPQRVCENCGAPLDDDAVFCSECGTPVAAKAHAAPAAPNITAFVPPPAAPVAPAPQAAPVAKAVRSAKKGMPLGAKIGIGAAAVAAAAAVIAGAVFVVPGLLHGKEAASVSWAVEPTIEADDIDAMIQGIANISAEGEWDFNTLMSRYAYPLCAITRGGKVGIIKYDGTVLVEPNYAFYHVGNQAQLLVGNSYYLKDSGTPYPAPPTEHDMWLVTERGVAADKYYGGDYTTATPYFPSGGSVLTWGEGIGVGTYGEGGFCVRTGVNYTGAALYLPDAAAFTPETYGDVTLYGTADWLSAYGGVVPVFENERVGTEVYENVGPYAEGLWAVEKDGKWGYIDSAGKTVFPCVYDASWKLSNVQHGSTFTPYEVQNEIEPNNGFAYPASEGYLVLCKNGEYGLYTTDGKQAIPFGEYEALRPVCGGKLWAKQDGKWGVLQLEDAPAVSTPAALVALPLSTPEPTAAPTPAPTPTPTAVPSATPESPAAEPAATAAPPAGDTAASPEPTAAPAQSTAGEYVFPHSDSTYLTDADLRGLDAATLRIARNEILARHGRMFNSADLQQYFNGCSWYHGTIPADSFSFSVLNKVELANIELIKSYE